MNKTLRIVVPLGILLLGLVSAVLMIRSRPQVERREVSFPPPLVRVLEIRQQDVRLKVGSQGTVSPRTESDLIAQVAGQVIYVSPQFAAGGFFQKDDILIRIDPRDYEFAIARLKAEVAQARLRLVQEEGEASIAREEWERLAKDETPNPLVLREPQLTQAKAVLEAAEAALQQARLNLDRTRIRAPFDGRVRIKKADVGEYVTTGTPLAVIYAVDYAEVRLPVPDGDMAYLDCCIDYRGQRPQPLDLEVDLRADYAQQEYSWQGKIVRVEGEIDPLTHMVTLVARVQDPYSRQQRSTRPPLAVGLFVRAEIMGRMVPDAVVIPRSALRGTDQVLIIDDNNRLHFRPVEVLKKDAESVVLNGGLESGERVCLSPLDAVVEGMPVRVSRDDTGSGGNPVEEGLS
jgi:RND family efflux transporter MFP subunit